MKYPTSAKKNINVEMGFWVYQVGLEVSQAFYDAEEDHYESISRWESGKVTGEKNAGNMEFQEMVVIILWLCSV